MKKISQRCVIVSAAEIKNYKKITSLMKPEDFYIFCDGGLNHREGLGVEPELVVGDFDSFDKGRLTIGGTATGVNNHLPSGGAATGVDDHHLLI